MTRLDAIAARLAVIHPELWGTPQAGLDPETGRPNWKQPHFFAHAPADMKALLDLAVAMQKQDLAAVMAATKYLHEEDTP